MSLIPSAPFKQQGSGDQESWDLAFENGYTDGFKKTNSR